MPLSNICPKINIYPNASSSIIHSEETTKKSIVFGIRFENDKHLKP